MALAVRAVGRVAGAVLVAALATGCASDAAGGRPTHGASGRPVLGPSAMFADHLAQAEAGGAGEAQLAVLRAAERTGEIDFDTVLGLVERSLACMERSGISSETPEPHELLPGHAIPAYSFAATAEGMTEDEVLEAADACLYEHSYWAEAALADPRGFPDAYDAALREDLPDVLACLEENGAEVDDDATLEEVRVAAAELTVRQLEAGDDEPVECTNQDPLAWQ